MTATRVNVFPSRARQSFAAETIEPPQTHTVKLKPLDMSMCFCTEPPPLDFVWPGFLTGTIGALCAAGSTGKSIYSLEAAMCVASPLANVQLLDLDIKTHGRVVILNAEDNDILLWHRLHAIASFLSPEARLQVSANVVVVPVVGMGVDISDQNWVDAVCEIGKGARLIVLDTHSRWAGSAAENDNTAQTQVIKKYEHISRATGSAILFLHHVAKSMMMEGRQDEQGAARGASAITDAARYQAWMQGMPDKIAKGFAIKERDRRRFVGFGSGKVNATEKDPEARWHERKKGGILIPMRTRAELARDNPTPLTAAECAPATKSEDYFSPELRAKVAAASPFARCY